MRWLMALRGVAYEKKGQYGQAIANYSKVISMHPKDAMTYLQRGCAYYHKDMYNSAISDFTTAIALNPKNARGYCNRGLAQTKMALLYISL